MAIILALDLGTSKIAAIAFDCARRKTVALLASANTATVDGLRPGRHEQDPEIICCESVDLLRRLAQSGEFPVEDVKVIAISGQMHGVLLADRELKPVTGLITWCDRRAMELTAAIDRASWPVDRTGCYLHPGYGGATLAALAREKPLPPGLVALTIADFLAARLSGGATATDPTHAASWGIMDIRRNCWDTGIVSRLGIPPGILPDIKASLSELGPLEVDLGLPRGVSVRLPLGDNQASFIGACGLNNDALLVNLGTGGQISLPCPEFYFDPELETRPMPFGAFLLVGASLFGGRSYAYLKDFFRETLRELGAVDASDERLYQAMSRMAANARQILAVDTRFAGTRMQPELRGAIGGIGGDNFTPGALCRGFLQGMVRELTGRVRPELYKNFRKALVSGNAVRKNPLVRQMIEEELGLPGELTENPEEAAAGAALAAAKAANLT